MKIIGKVLETKVTYRGFCVCDSVLDAERIELEENEDGDLIGTCPKCDAQCQFERKFERVIQQNLTIN